MKQIWINNKTGKEVEVISSGIICPELNDVIIIYTDSTGFKSAKSKRKFIKEFENKGIFVG